MPTNALDWNHSVEYDSKESIFDTLSKHYVDPWDLENYAYIREHLDSLELSSQSSSFSESVEINYPVYSAPAPSKTYFPAKPKFDSLLESDYGTAKYAEIEDVYKKVPNKKSSQLESFKNKDDGEDLYGIANFGLEPEYGIETEDLYGVRKRSSSTTLYESSPRPKFTTPKRRMTYSEDNYGYSFYNSPRSIYSRIENNRKSQSERYTPTYDKVGTNRPNHFGLSNYGHLQIDYSFSWNILDKYIRN